MEQMKEAFEISSCDPLQDIRGIIIPMMRDLFTLFSKTALVIDKTFRGVFALRGFVMR